MIPDLGEVAAAGDVLSPAPRGVRVTRTTGQVVEGEVLAAVDHRLGWTPQPQTSWLVYDPRGRAPWPGDRSVRVVRDDEVARVQWAPRVGMTASRTAGGCRSVAARVVRDIRDGRRAGSSYSLFGFSR